MSFGCFCASVCFFGFFYSGHKWFGFLWCVQSLGGEEGEARPPLPMDEATAFLRKGNRDFRNSRFKEVSCFDSKNHRMTLLRTKDAL